MNVKKLEKQTKKINQLLDNIKDEGSVSVIEKDLLLSYIRDLYEKALDLEGKAKTSKEKVSSYVAEEQETIKEATKPTAPPVEIADVVRNEVVQSEPVYSTDNEMYRVPGKTFIPPVEETPAVVVQQEEPAYEKPKNESPKYDAPILEPIVESSKSIPSELESLFTLDAVNEISDRLSRTPIADLNRSMGINEKIFTVKELFGGDSDLFSKTMNALNSLSSLEQAKDYLVEHVAIDQEWASDSKIKKAATFIKLISRRY